MKKIFLCMVCILCLSGCPGVSAEKELTLNEILEDTVEIGALGISCYLWHNGTYEYETAGLSGMETNSSVAITDLHMFRIGSQSKMFYGAAVSVLISEGHISENVNISEYLPVESAKGLTNGDIITVGQLIHHTSGLFDYLNDDEEFSLAVVEDTSRIWTISEVLTFVYGKTAMNEPGEAYRYSNTNYLLLAYIIENITGDNAAVYVRDRVLDPLGLDNTYIDVYENFDRTLLVNGYYSNEETGILDMRDTYGDMPGDGGIVSTPENVYKFLNSVLNNYTYPAADTRAAFLHAFLPQSAAEGLVISDENYGAGIKAQQYNGELFYTHGGDIPGYHAEIFYFPETDKGFCFMMSSVTTENSESVDTAITQLYISLFDYLD